MANGDAMINRTTVEQPTATSLPSALPPEPPKQPGKFSKIFGGIAGAALNILAPGAGSLIGGFINRGGLDYGGMQSMLQQQQLQSFQMLAIQNRVQTQTQEFTTVSNLLKARHDGEMSAVHNFKS
jgi:predicted lipid-binding transport protein (Tim44 family)